MAHRNADAPASRRSRSRHARPAALLAVLLLGAPVAGQEPAAVDTPAAEPIVAADERRIDRSGVFVGATVGSAAGLLIGASGGDSFGGDDWGISSVVLGAVLFDGAAVLLGYTFGQGAVATLVTTIIEPGALPSSAPAAIFLLKDGRRLLATDEQ